MERPKGTAKMERRPSLDVVSEQEGPCGTSTEPRHSYLTTGGTTWNVDRT